VHWEVFPEPSASFGEQPTLTVRVDTTVQQPRTMTKALHSRQALLFSLVNTIRRNKIVLHFVRPSDSRVNDVEANIS